MNRDFDTVTQAERDLMDRAEAWFEAHRKEFIADLIDWVGTVSVSDASQAAPGAPFGPEVARIFDKVLQRAQALGFETENHDGYAISVLSGEGEDELGLASHLDVVPLGSNWAFDPFQPFERDGFVIGRGSYDNKGPALLDLYLLRFFRDEGLPFKHRLRVIYGGAEETGMADMQYYAAHCPVPKLTIVTDGGFPVNFAQKGSLHARLTVPTGPVLARFSAGTAENAVPNLAAIILPGQTPAELEAALASLPADLRATLEIEGAEEGARLIARGRAGHSAFPETTQNAIPLLARALDEANLVQGRDREAARYLAQALKTPWGDGTGIAHEDKDLGNLTQNGGIVAPCPGGLALTLDIRFPASVSKEELLSGLERSVSTVGGSLEALAYSDPVNTDRNGPLVGLLQSTFNMVAEAQTQPFAMGGGTHARVLPRSVTFGPGFRRIPDIPINGHSTKLRPAFIPEGHGAPHAPDEFVMIDNLLRAMRIYVVTLTRLDQWLSND